jgi:hypothetical protein
MLSVGPVRMEREGFGASHDAATQFVEHMTYVV